MGRKSASERAYNFCLDFIRRQHLEGSIQLPTIQHMAQGAHVSYVTMQKVLARIKKEGIMQGVGVVPAREEERYATLPVKRLEKYRHIAQSIEAEIIRGAYMPGTLLPSLKELGIRYGVCFRTLKEGLNELIRKNRITPYKKGYRVNDFSGNLPGGIVVCIARGSQSPDAMSHEYNYLFHTTEYECSKRNLRLMPVLYRYENARFHIYNRKEGLHFSPALSKRIVGFLIFMRGMQGINVVELMNRLSAYKKPIGVFDETGIGRFSRENIVNPCNILVIQSGLNTNPGLIAGRFLIDLGHRKTAFFSPGNANWTLNRLKGVQKAFSEASITRGVKQYVVDATDLGRVNGLTLTEQVQHELNLIQTTLKNKGAFGERMRDAIWQMRTEGLTNSVVATLNRLNRRKKLNELFSRALKQEKITAWVCANDSIAFEALNFLAEHSIDVPQHLSVIGFDDINPALLFYRLTSYNFNFPSVINALVTHLLDSSPKKNRFLPKVHFLEIEGFINSRGTVGPPR